MKHFRAIIDITFFADDIDDAFRKLEDHFYNLRTAKVENSLLDEAEMRGELTIEEEK